MRYERALLKTVHFFVLIFFCRLLMKFLIKSAYFLAPIISISPQPKTSKQANVRFATFAHEPEEAEIIETISSIAPLSIGAPKPIKEIETCDRQVSTDPVLVSSLECQTSPQQLVHIFTQTEEVSSETETKSVAVQSSPESKTDCHVQTEEVSVKSVAVGTSPKHIQFTKGLFNFLMVLFN